MGADPWRLPVFRFLQKRTMTLRCASESSTDSFGTSTNPILANDNTAQSSSLSDGICASCTRHRGLAIYHCSAKAITPTSGSSRTGWSQTLETSWQLSDLESWVWRLSLPTTTQPTSTVPRLDLHISIMRTATFDDMDVNSNTVARPPRLIDIWNSNWRSTIHNSNSARINCGIMETCLQLSGRFDVVPCRLRAMERKRTSL